MSTATMSDPISTPIATPQSDPPPAMPARAGGSRRWVLLGIKLLVSAVILIGIVRSIASQQGLSSIGDAIASLGWGWVAAALGVHLAGVALNVVRYREVLRGQGIHASWRFLAGSFLVGRFFGALSPAGFTGLAGWRIYEVGTHTRKFARATAAITIDTIVGQLAFGAMVMIGSLFGARIIGTSGVLVVNAAFAVVMGIGVTVLARPRLFAVIAARLPAKLRVRGQTLVDAMQAYRGQTRILLVTLLCAIGVHAAHFFVYVCVARALSASQIGTGEVFFGSSLQILATMMPVSINGIGLREATAVALYTSPAIGVPLALAVLIPSIGFAVEMSVSILGAPIWLARRSGYAPVITVDDPDREQPAIAAIPIAPESAWPSVRRGTEIGAGAGLMAGLLIGLVEGAIVVEAAAGRAGPWVMAYGAIAYALFCGVVGGGAGFALAWSGRRMKREAVAESDAWARMIAALCAGIGFGLTAFRIRRDVFHEELAWRSLRGVGVLFACMLGAAIVYALMNVSLAFVARRLRFLLRPLGTPLIVLAVLGVLVPTTLAIGEPSTNDAHVVHGASAPTGAGNVIVIVVDTLRADHLPSYGYANGHTPNLDAFASDAIRFEQAFSNASWTRPSFASIMTGRYPSSHATMAKSASLPDEVSTMAEAFAAGGYATHGIVTNYNVGPYFNFQQGFDAYEYLSPDFVLGADDTAAKLLLVQFLRQQIEGVRDAALGVQPGTAYQDAAVVNRHVLSFLDRAPNDRPWMLFVGYMDPHDPYFRHPYDGSAYGRAAHPNPSPDEAAMLTTLYDGEITFWDEQFGQLVSELRRRGVYDNTTIVVTADHGEELFDHGGFWHGTTLYDEQIHVPLFVRLPGGRRAGTTVRHWVQSIDLMPTLLREQHVDVPAGVQGGDLFEGSDHLFAEESHEGNVLEAVRERRGTDELKLITANPGNPRHLAERELYRVDTDATEQHDLAPTEHALVESLDAATTAARVRASEGAAAGQAAQLTEDDHRRLCALGYEDHDVCCARGWLGSAACAH
jgi:arylsulfatase A-like enzyme/uncharacterized membrane protein YbhN (UPF0104 family)